MDIVAAMESVVAAAAAGRRPSADQPECTLGAAIVWRAAERAAARGADPDAAAEAGLRAGAAYLRLASEVAPAAVSADVNRCVELLVGELRSRPSPAGA